MRMRGLIARAQEPIGNAVSCHARHASRTAQMIDPDDRNGILIVLSSPSGAGKSTMTRRLLADHRDIRLSVSVTTRPPRPGEIDGQDYHFISREEFASLIERGELIEHAEVFGHRYGTPRGPVEKTLSGGQARKSTRLNSSHVAISYAVSCLKQQKIPARLAQLNHT